MAWHDDTKDAGEIGAGHCVTALYEVVPTGVEADLAKVDPSRYQSAGVLSGKAFDGELLFLKLRLFLQGVAPGSTSDGSV